MLNDWARFWQTVTPETIVTARALCRPDIRFIDPFNDITGVDRLEALLHHMFSAVDAPRFVVTDQAMGQAAGYLRWDFTAQVKGRPFTLTGMSEVVIHADGRVALHRDHWDAGAQVYEQVPLLGAVLRRIRSRLSLPAS